jgi:pimeloyl-[acyl-carrier protein] methyl ester esterase
MHIERTGSGPDLVLLHGWAMHGDIFAPLIDALRSHWTLHVVDLPGHGRSRDDATALTLDSLAGSLLASLPRAVWVGWSMGGLVAQRAALSNPRKVRALVAIASSPRFVAASDWPHGVGGEVFRQFGADLQADWRGTVERFLALEVLGSAHAHDDLRVLRANLFAHGEPAPHVLAHGLAILDTTDLRGDLAGLTIPSVWIAGRRDRLVPAAAVAAAADIAPGGEFVGIAGAGHAPFLQHAEAIADAIARLGDRAP